MKEGMKDELWMKKIKERLDDYSEPLPPMGWERLAKDLSASKPSNPSVRRIIPLRRWGISAAAVLLAAVSSVSLWLWQSPMADEVGRVAVPTLAIAPDNLPEVTVPSLPTDEVQPMCEARYRKNPLVEEVSITQEALPTESLPYVEQTSVADTPQIQEKTQSTAARRPSGKDKLHLPIETKKSARSKEWAVGLSIGNTGGLTNLNQGGSENMLQNSPSMGIGSDNLDLSSTANSIVSIPNSQELVFKGGMPYILRKGKQLVSADHRQPLSFGLSVRKNLGKGFSVESGLTYTYLASELQYDDSYEKLDQKLHYVGVPVRANWNFVDNERFVMYVSGGGAIEKCVYGKVGSENQTVKPIQLSVMGAVGAQYNISNRVGVYVEPGVSYFFNDKSGIETIRKENPCNFTLQAGLRLTY